MSARNSAWSSGVAEATTSRLANSPPGTEAACHLGQQALLALVLQVVDGEPRDDDVELPEGLDGVGQVPVPNRHPGVAVKGGGGPLQHGR